MAQSKSPNEKLDIAVIGVGGRGKANIAALATENIVALGDVDDNRAGDTYTRYPGAKNTDELNPYLRHEYRKGWEIAF